MRKVSREKLVDFGCRFLVKKGVAEDNARYIAEVAVDSEAFGVVTHGIVIFGYYDAQIPSSINPKALPVVVKDRGAAAVIDGSSGFGQLAMRKAKELAVEKARNLGIAMIGINNCHWLGAVGPYLISLAEEGFLAQLWAQTSTCKDCAPFGGIDARFSTNPVALAFPTDGDPVIADFSTATVALGKVNQMSGKGEKAPEKIFLDKDGRSSDDPNAMLEGGTIHFVGGEKYGYKGYGLSLWCEALTALSGGECNNPDTLMRQSFNLTVIDPDAFAGADYYANEMKRFGAHLKSSRVREGFDGIHLPGERAYSKLKDALKDGVPLDDNKIQNLNALGQKNGMPKI